MRIILTNDRLEKEEGKKRCDFVHAVSMAEFGEEVKRLVTVRYVSPRGGITDVDTVDLGWFISLTSWHLITPQKM